MQPVPMPAPYGGINEALPRMALQSPQCESLLNFNVTKEGVTLRHGDSKYIHFDADTGAYRVFNYGTSNAFMIGPAYTSTVDFTKIGLNIYDIDSGDLVYNVGTVLGTSYSFSGLYFNRYLFFLTADPGFSGGIAFNGSTFGAIGYTGSGFAPTCGNSFNHRVYLAQYPDSTGTASYWYGEIDAISGALTRVNLDTITNDNCYIVGIGAFTLSDDVSAIKIQAFIMSNGEILFYSGSYPDSDDWSEIGTAKINSPLDYQSLVKYKNDQLLLCDEGPVSLKDLFLKNDAEEAGIISNDRIRDTWTSIVKAVRAEEDVPDGPLPTLAARGVWDQDNSRLIFSFGWVFNSEDPPAIIYGCIFFVYDTKQNAWFFHQSVGFFDGLLGAVDIVAYKKKILIVGPATFFVGPTIWVKEGAEGFTDENQNDTDQTGYPYEIISAPITNGRAYVQLAKGLDVIQNTDLYEATEYQFVRDFGVAETTAQKLPSDSPSDLQKPNVDIGIEGSFIQYKIAGTTVEDKTVGLELYGTNVWIELGNAPR